MTAADHIDQRLKACAEVQGRIRGQLTKLEHALPAAARWTGEVRQLMIELNQQLQLIKVDMAVDVMTGAVEGRTAQEPVEVMELFVAAAGGGQECPRSFRGAGVAAGEMYYLPAQKFTGLEDSDTLRRGVDERILKSLHRAGDHTLDVGDDELEQAGSTVARREGA